VGQDFMARREPSGFLKYSMTVPAAVWLIWMGTPFSSVEIMVPPEPKKAISAYERPLVSKKLALWGLPVLLKLTCWVWSPSRVLTIILLPELEVKEFEELISPPPEAVSWANIVGRSNWIPD